MRCEWACFLWVGASAVECHGLLRSRSRKCFEKCNEISAARSLILELHYHSARCLFYVPNSVSAPSHRLRMIMLSWDLRSSRITVPASGLAISERRQVREFERKTEQDRTGEKRILPHSLSLSLSLPLSLPLLPPSTPQRGVPAGGGGGVDSRCRHSHEMLVTLGGSPKRAHAAEGMHCRVRLRLKGVEVGRFPKKH